MRQTIINATTAEGTAIQIAKQETTVAEYAAIMELPCPEVNRDNESGAVNDRACRESWTGPEIKRVADARTMLDSGWSEGAARLAKLAKEVNVPAARSRRRVGRWSDDGDTLDVDRAMRGDLESWRVTRRKWSLGPTTIDLVTIFGGNCHLSADELFWSGAASVVLADILEEAGYSVRVIGVAATRYWNDTPSFSINTVVVKDTNEPLRVDAMASIVCNPGTFRTHGFKAICQCPWDVGSGLGSCMERWDREFYGTDLTKIWGLAGYDLENTITLNQATSREACVAEINLVIKHLDSLAGD